MQKEQRAVAYRTSDDWVAFLGEQIKAIRLRKNMSQEELAARAGVSLPTVSHLESGKGSSLSTFVKALQVLKEEAWLEQLAPQVAISPLQIHQRGKMRQRARGGTKDRGLRTP
jgi:transcriptional regulator with XRE-family HTH domain